MNKKFSTLVAALLASGGLFYAVDAMVLPAGDGVAKYVTTVAKTGEAATTITGYEIVAGTLKDGAAWKLVSTGEGDTYYLATGEAGDVYYLSADCKMQKSDASGATFLKFTFAKGILSTESEGTKYLAIAEGGAALELVDGEDKAAGLFTAEGALATSVSAPFAIGTITTEKEAAELSSSMNAVKIKTTAGESEKWTVAETAVGAVEATSQITFVNGTSDNSSKVFIKISEKFLTVADGALALAGEEPTGEVATASAVTIAETTNLVKIGSEYLKVADGALSVTSDQTAPETGKVYAATAIAAKTDALTSSATLTDSEGKAYLYSTTETGGTGTEIANVDLFTYEAGTPDTYSAVSATANNEDDDQKFTWAEGILSIGENKLKVNESALTVASEGTAFKLDDGGAIQVSAGGNYLAYTSTGGTLSVETSIETGKESLYLYDATSKALITDASKIEGAVIIATASFEDVVVNLTDESSVVTTKATEEIVTPPEETVNPGEEIPGMDEVTVDESGVVTPKQETQNIPAPVTIVYDGGTISLDAKGNVVVAAPSAEDKITAIDLVLENGHLMSVARQKQNLAKRYLKKKTASTLRAEATAAYDFVEVYNASTVTFDASGNMLIDGTSVGKPTIKVSDVAPAASQSIWSGDSELPIRTHKAIENGEFVLLGAAVEEGGTTYNVLYGADATAPAALYQVKETQAVKGGVYSYSFTNKSGEVLSIDDNGTAYNVFTSDVAYDGGLKLKANNGKFVNMDKSGNLTLSTTATIFGLYQAGTKDFTADFLKTKEGNSFSVTVKDNTGKNDELQGNVFTGSLVPVANSDGSGSYKLMSDKKYIVLDTKAKWSDNGTGTILPVVGYKFTTVTKATLDKDTEGRYISDFKVGYLASDNTDKTCAPTAKTGIAYIQAGDYYVSTYNSEKKDYLTVSDNKDNLAVISFGGSNLVKGTDLLLGYATIKVANTSKATKDYQGMAVGVTQEENTATPAVALLSAQNVDTTKPEGQWAITLKDASDDASEYVFTNRESKQAFSMTLYKTAKEDVYKVASAKVGSQTAAFLTPETGVTIDTLRIEAAEVGARVQMDGYFNEKIDVTRDNAYTIAVASAVEGVDDIYLAENHSNKHLIGLTGVEGNATQWKLIPQTGGRFDIIDPVAETTRDYTDSVYVFNDITYKNAKNEYKTRRDTLAMISYVIVNNSNNEPIYKSADEVSYICNPEENALKNAQRFVIKEKNGKYNLVKIAAPDVENGAKEASWSYADNKLYGAITTADGRVKDANAYQYIANDMFNVTPVAAPEYRKITDKQDTTVISIYRQENDFQYLYEKGEFLNIDNKAQFTGMNPALMADTAYVNRDGNNRWQYLLAVNAERKIKNDDCGVPSHEKFHTDTTYGRFLVNLIDSAVVTNARKIHDNKYINTNEAGENMAKLGFVYGYHTNDSLYITDGKDGKVMNRLFLGNKDFNQAKFAFRYTDPQNTKAFKIQTRYIDYEAAIADNLDADTDHNNGYLKWINGTVVVVNGLAQGDEFNMNENETRTPTANDAIDATEVSVIAGNGTVTIKGAEGKKVSISNVLGQTIANTVITSSEAQISVPAGIVVVAVEGEAAVKAIVK